VLVNNTIDELDVVNVVGGGVVVKTDTELEELEELEVVLTSDDAVDRSFPQMRLPRICSRSAMRTATQSEL
jgi:hypothetical protein